jgi:hypothetical protein
LVSEKKIKVFPDPILVLEHHNNMNGAHAIDIIKVYKVDLDIENEQDISFFSCRYDNMYGYYAKPCDVRNPIPLNGMVQTKCNYEFGSESTSLSISHWDNGLICLGTKERPSYIVKNIKRLDTDVYKVYLVNGIKTRAGNGLSTGYRERKCYRNVDKVFIPKDEYIIESYSSATSRDGYKSLFGEVMSDDLRFTDKI